MPEFIVNTTNTVAIEKSGVNGVFVRASGPVAPIEYNVVIQHTHLGHVDFETADSMAQAKQKAGAILTELQA